MIRLASKIIVSLSVDNRETDNVCVSVCAWRSLSGCACETIIQTLFSSVGRKMHLYFNISVNA